MLDDVPVLALDYLLSLQINAMSAEDVYKYRLLSNITWIFLFAKKCTWHGSIVNFFKNEGIAETPCKNQNF